MHNNIIPQYMGYILRYVNIHHNSYAKLVNHMLNNEYYNYSVCVYEYIIHSRWGICTCEYLRPIDISGQWGICILVCMCMNIYSKWGSEITHVHTHSSSYSQRTYVRNNNNYHTIASER